MDIFGVDVILVLLGIGIKFKFCMCIYFLCIFILKYLFDLYRKLNYDFFFICLVKGGLYIIMIMCYIE